MFNQLKKVWLVLLATPFLWSCATYNNKLQNYYSYLNEGNYSKAENELTNNKFLKKNRNRILMLMEFGKLYHLKKQYDTSNYFLNRADDLIDANRKTVGDAIVGNISNPMLQNYTPENFEIFMVHYYKSLNYLNLNKYENALVEAKRIGLSNQVLQDKFSTTTSKYNQDAFANNLQGLLFEINGEINNAFISYRNAAEIYLNNKNSYYGVEIPMQLKKDLLRTAQLLGFTNEYNKFSKEFNIEFNTIADSNKNELIVFIETQNIPTKTQFEVFLSNAGFGNIGFIDANGMQQNINLNNQGFINTSSISKIRSFKVAIPAYNYVRSNSSDVILITVNNKKYNAELCQNFVELAPTVLKQRMLQEVTKAAIRQLVKYGLQKGTEEAVKSLAKEKDEKEESKKTEEEKQKSKEKKERAEALGELAGFLMNSINTATEKADTRNWQSLPGYIYYVRLPIDKGKNEIEININGKVIKQNINCNKRFEIINMKY